MYADDLIILVKTRKERKANRKLLKICKIIESYGLKVNKEKTEIHNSLKNVKYLGVFFKKEDHIKYCIEKAKYSFKSMRRFLRTPKLNSRYKLHLYKSTILSVLFFGMEIFNFTKEEYNKIDVLINTHLKLILKLPRYFPTEILRIETLIPKSEITINLKKLKFSKKLYFLGFNDLFSLQKFSYDINFEENNNISKQRIWKEIFNNIKNNGTSRVKKYCNDRE